jgi:hypothetical protein
MKPCERIRQQALAVVALAPGERELKEAWEHARTCAGCAQALQAAEGMLALVDAELAPSPPSAETLLRAKRAVELELDRQPARSLQAARVAAALAPTGAGAALAGPWAHHHHQLDASSVALGAGAAITAVALAWLGVGRRAAGAAFAACAVSLVVAALASTSLGLFAAVGVHCLALELFTAAWPLAALAAAGGLSSSTSSWTTAALASTGALAGHAALHLTCPERSAAPHLLTFHLGGVVLAAVAGLAVPRAMCFVNHVLA